MNKILTVGKLKKKNIRCNRQIKSYSSLNDETSLNLFNLHFDTCTYLTFLNHLGSIHY